MWVVGRRASACLWVGDLSWVETNKHGGGSRYIRVGETLGDPALAGVGEKYWAKGGWAGMTRICASGVRDQNPSPYSGPPICVFVFCFLSRVRFCVHAL